MCYSSQHSKIVVNALIALLVTAMIVIQTYLKVKITKTILQTKTQNHVHSGSCR